MRVVHALATAALVVAGCTPDEGPSMAPFQDCLPCHGGTGGKGESGPTWTAAGTWARGARVELVDANGKSVSLTGNEVGNFYTAESLAFPLRVSVDGTAMPRPITYGGCNLCHHAEAITVGPLMAPGQDCLGCHHSGGVAGPSSVFAAAGTTWAGARVVVEGVTTTANAVGNFFYRAGQQGWGPPWTASVNGSTMPSDEFGDGYLGCNSCHRGGVFGEP